MTGLKAIERIMNPATGQWVILPKPIILTNGDLDSFIAGYQACLVNESAALQHVTPELTEPRTYDYPFSGIPLPRRQQPNVLTYYADHLAAALDDSDPTKLRTVATEAVFWLRIIANKPGSKDQP